MNAALDDVKAQYPGANVEEPFLAGYQRGREHYQQLATKPNNWLENKVVDPDGLGADPCWQ